ncbi:EamA family transporter, partial [Bacillus wiedmannii]
MFIFKLKRKEIMPHVFSKRIMYAGFCLTFMTFASLYWAEQYISSGLAAVLSATGPMMILLLQARRNKKQLQKEQFFALIIALIGVVFVSLPGMHQEVSFIWSIACIILVVG